MSTLKGACIIGQSGGPTAAINATLAGVIRGALDEIAKGDGATITHLYGMRNGVDGLLREDIVELDALFAPDADGKYTALDRLTLTPAAALGSCRKKLPAAGAVGEAETMDKLFAIFAKYDIRYFFYIGGNDSMDTVAKVSAYAEKVGYPIRVMGVPKTIDNDLVGTDHTPGFGSAAKFVATTVKEMLRDVNVYTVKAVTIVEIMGRDAGWLTASSALGRLNGDTAPDLIYLCERPFCVDQFLDDVREKMAEKHSIIVAVSEGIRNEEGDYITDTLQDRAADAFGHKILAGASRYLEEIIRYEIGCKVRSIELSVMQRCASHVASAADIYESRLLGAAAADYCISGGTGKMAVIKRISDKPYRFEIDFVEIEKIANQVKKVPDEWINEAGNDVTQEMIDYILPLIQGELPCTFKNGVPVHLRLY